MKATNNPHSNVVLRKFLPKLKKNVNLMFSTSTQIVTSSETKIQIIGGKEYDDLKQYILYQFPSTFNIRKNYNDTKSADDMKPIKVASILLKRNILFSTQLHDSRFDYITSCLPIVTRAMNDAGQYGDQPQGIASLSGLCSYMRSNFQSEPSNPTIQNRPELISRLELKPSVVIQKLKQDASSSQESKIILEALEAISFQIPRQGHQTIGLGTYLDARKGLDAIGKEFASQGGSPESSLFLKAGGFLTKIEHVGKDDGGCDDKYLIDAAGVMARFFFI